VTSTQFEDNREFAQALDRDDPLAEYRQRFNFPRQRNGRSPVYFCGNSLGLQPQLAVDYVKQELQHWHELGVDGHFHSERPWSTYHRLATDGFASLTGARPDEVIAMNTLTVNLHLLMASFYRPTEQRRKIVIEAGAFPSDQYAAASQIRLHGYDPDADLLEWHARDGEATLRTEDLEALLERQGDSVALLLLPGVQYFTGQVLDMAAICDLGRQYRCKVGLDLAHAVGNVELSLSDWGPDFASWCTYKYLNGGPGSIAGAFVHRQHRSPDDYLHGWWGNKESSRFKMRPHFEPAEGAEAWQMSNPPILSLAPVVASLKLFEEAGFERLRKKSVLLTAYLRWLVHERHGDRITTITPDEAHGCQLSWIVRNPESENPRQLFNELSTLNVIGDWREPNVIRMAPVPLYNSFEDVFEFAERLTEALGR
jgi:kynureninase